MLKSSNIYELQAAMNEFIKTLVRLGAGSQNINAWGFLDNNHAQVHKSCLIKHLIYLDREQKVYALDWDNSIDLTSKKDSYWIVGDLHISSTVTLTAYVDEYMSVEDWEEEYRLEQVELTHLDLHHQFQDTTLPQEVFEYDSS